MRVKSSKLQNRNYLLTNATHSKKNFNMNKGLLRNKINKIKCKKYYKINKMKGQRNKMI